MKQTTKLLLALLILTGSQQLMAQNSKDKRSKKTSITIVTEEDGKKTVIDTTFENASQADINTFLKRKGVMKTPPAPPAAPNAPSAPAPPEPPAPPAAPDEDANSHSYNFHFEMPDIDDSFNMDLEDAMTEAKEALENAKIHMRISMDDNDQSTEEMEKMIEEKVHKQVEKEMKQYKDDQENMEDDDGGNKKIEKHIIIKKKTSDNEWNDNDADVVLVSPKEHHQIVRTVSAYSADGSDPIVLTEDFKGLPSSYSTHYSYCTENKKKEGNFKHFLKNVKEYILN